MNQEKERYTVEPYSLIRDLIRNVWVIILAGLIGAMGVFIINNNTYTPMYTSTVTLIANVKTGAEQLYTNLSASTELATIYSEVFVQPSMKDRAADYLGMPDFKGSVSSKTLDKTNIFTVSVTTTSPKLAYEELCAVLQVYPQISEAIFADAVIEIMRAPTMPKAPSNTISSKYGVVAVLACMALVAGLTVFFSLNRDTVKTEEDYRRKIGSPLLGTVGYERPHQPLKNILKGEKKSRLINDAFASFRFSESYQKLANKFEYMHRTNGDKVFLLTSVAENEGKSTTAANTAIALASRENRVLLLDMDFKKPAMHKIFGFEVEADQDFGALLAQQISAEQFRFRRYRHSTLFTAFNAGRHGDYVDWIHSKHIERVMDVFRGFFDYIIIDSPPLSVAADVSGIAQIVDRTVLVVKTDTVLAADINDAILTISSGENRFAGCILNALWPEFTLLGSAGSDESGYTSRYGKYGKYDKYSKYSHYSRYGGHYARKTISDDLLDDDAKEETGDRMTEKTGKEE